MEKLRLNPLWLFLGWFIVISIIYLSVTPTPPDIYSHILNIDKLKHVFAYFVLMGWFSQLYRNRNIRVSYAIVFFIMGAILEILQGISQQRHFEYIDMLANGIGVMLALFIASIFKWNLFQLFENRMLSSKR